jgi:hypothetical protein
VAAVPTLDNLIQVAAHYQSNVLSCLDGKSLIHPTTTHKE